MARYALVKNMVDGIDRSGGKAVKSAVDRLTTAVRSAGERGEVLISIGGDTSDEVRHDWRVSLDKQPEPPEGRPDVTVRCSLDTFWRLLEGSYSPVEAFRDGMMRVRGDEQLAKRVLRHLAGPEGSVDCQ